MNITKRFCFDSLWQVLTILLAIIICHSFVMNSVALASNVSTEVQVRLGNTQGELKFFPNNLEFEAGKQYKLLLDNPSGAGLK